MKRINKTIYKRALCAAVLFMMALLFAAPMTAYAADDSLNITVKQVFTALPSSADSAFSYKLKPLSADNPMPPGSSRDEYIFTITGTNSSRIGAITYPRQGLYKYELYQIIETEKPGYSYDKNVYTIEVYADPARGIEIIIKNQDGRKTDEIVFSNSYSVLPSDPNLMADPPVRKTVFGNPGKSSSFLFRLTAQNPSDPMPPGSVNGVKTITVIGSGQGEFGTWSYEKEGVYYYTVYEVNSGERGYTYDTAVYTITDVVKAENGRLVLSRVVTNDTNRQVTSLSFNNKYDSGGTIIPEGPKPDGPKPDGPKTGDDSNNKLYSVVLAVGGVLVLCAVTYLLSGRSDRGGVR